MIRFLSIFVMIAILALLMLTISVVLPQPAEDYPFANVIADDFYISYAIEMYAAAPGTDAQLICQMTESYTAQGQVPDFEPAIQEVIWQRDIIDDPFGYCNAYEDVTLYVYVQTGRLYYNLLKVTEPGASVYPDPSTASTPIQIVQVGDYLPLQRDTPSMEAEGSLWYPVTIGDQTGWIADSFGQPPPNLTENNTFLGWGQFDQPTNCTLEGSQTTESGDFSILNVYDCYTGIRNSMTQQIVDAQGNVFDNYWELVEIQGVNRPEQLPQEIAVQDERPPTATLEASPTPRSDEAPVVAQVVSYEDQSDDFFTCADLEARVQELEATVRRDLTQVTAQIQLTGDTYHWYIHPYTASDQGFFDDNSKWVMIVNSINEAGANTLTAVHYTGDELAVGILDESISPVSDVFQSFDPDTTEPEEFEGVIVGILDAGLEAYGYHDPISEALAAGVDDNGDLFVMFPADTTDFNVIFAVIENEGNTPLCDIAPDEGTYELPTFSG